MYNLSYDKLNVAKGVNMNIKLSVQGKVNVKRIGVSYSLTRHICYKVLNHIPVAKQWHQTKVKSFEKGNKGSMHKTLLCTSKIRKRNVSNQAKHIHLAIQATLTHTKPATTV